MAAVLREQGSSEATSDVGEDPVVIVGAGPVGVRTAQELLRRCPDLPLVLYGAERSEPYNRVRLTSYLAGELRWDALTRDLDLPVRAGVERRYGCAVTAIDRAARTVTDATGTTRRYRRLVLATGSTPFVPDIPGSALPGVYTFRDVADAQRLFARSVRSRCTVVLGGGLLGLEAARAMRRYRTDIVVVEQEPRLMPQQLDAEAAALLRTHVESLGIRVVTGQGVRRVLGEGRVAGVRLRSGEAIDCDTVIVAAGIRPGIALALAAALPVDRGILVDDWLRTVDPHIHAVGECAQHGGVVYGLLAPGFEQAAVAAAVIAGARARYAGSTAVTRLKVLDFPVFSAGRVRETDRLDLARSRQFRGAGAYGRIVTERGRLIGALAAGALRDLGRLQEAVARRRRVLPWEAWRFARTGSLWPARERGGVAAWPDAVAVCNCTGVTRGELGRALAAGCASAQALAEATGASTVCGACRPLLAELAGSSPPQPPVRGARALLGIGGGAAALVLLALAFAVPYPASVQHAWMWDVLWRESFWKQVSGYTVAGLALLALALSLRKRVRRIRFGDFGAWRVAHAALAALTLGALAAHTGGRLGANLDLWLALAFLAVVAAGAGAGAVAALEHRLGARAVPLRRAWNWTHLLAAWPLPVLLGAHVFKSYYF